MKHSLYLIPAIAFLASCSTPETPAVVDDSDSTQAKVDNVAMAAAWPGYYEDTLPCADCPGIDTQLWVRSDSTFILREHYIERDSIPQGTIGRWHVMNDLMMIGSGSDKPEFWRSSANGLQNVDEMGQPFDSKMDYTLEKMADQINDEVPRMRLTGSYRYVADSHSFQPCGSTTVWPAGMGGGYAEEEGESLIPVPHLERAYRKAVEHGGDPWVIEVECHLGMGPAMEGDGADEYLFVHRLIRVLDPKECP